VHPLFRGFTVYGCGVVKEWRCGVVKKWSYEVVKECRCGVMGMEVWSMLLCGSVQGSGEHHHHLSYNPTLPHPPLAASLPVSDPLDHEELL